MLQWDVDDGEPIASEPLEHRGRRLGNTIGTYRALQEEGIVFKMRGCCFRLEICRNLLLSFVKI